MKFTEMTLSAALQHRLKAAGFETPTPVQEATIPNGLAGKDIVATAQTGTGKTLAFLVPTLEKLLATPTTRRPQVLVLVPTRELAMQVHAVYEQLRGKLPQAALVIGGLSENRQIQSLRSGARLVVATPGRLEDLLSRKLVDLRQIDTLVLDEADRMLDMGFLPAIKRIIAATPATRQTLCFSATMPPAISAIVADYMRTPVRVSLGSTLKPAATVELHAFEVSQANKLEALRQLLYAERGSTLVFAKTKRGTERLAKNLIRDGFSATMIHGDRTQAQRTRALADFVDGKSKILVATDVAARGLDVPEVAHVINYDLPQVAEDFIHRVGRTGRAGMKGRASTLVSAAENIELRHIERTMKLRIERKDIQDLDSAPASRVMRDTNTLRSRTLSALPGEVFA
ncbi:MAG TPA: DEAD/DEAH box helicase [Terriglobales bacterium]|nr:DEAD/DEAH box helicase [Terriglobales bacterium]